MRKKVLNIFLIALISVLVFSFVCAFSWLIAYLTSRETGLPRLDISVDEKINSKEEYVSCEISISNTLEEYEISGATGGIRGRGNTTWKYPKKPYRIKLDSKASLIGENASKSWVLLAMYNDFSLSKDALAFKLGASLENGDYVPSYHYVDLYINGVYEGLYLLTEHINENDERTNVEYKFDKNHTEVPFLIELDDYAELDGGVEGVDYFKVGNCFYTIKYPDSTERYTQAQFEYIKNYITKVHNLAHKKNATIKELEELVDVTSFIDYYLVQEIMIQTDMNYKSVFMYKSIDGKMKMGPLWDYDWALDGPSLMFWYDYELKAQELAGWGTWFSALLKNSPEFRSAVKLRWGEIEDKIRLACEEFELESQAISRAAHKDWLRWHYYNIGADYKTSLDKALNVLHQRIDWLDTKIENL